MPAPELQRTRSAGLLSKRHFWYNNTEEGKVSRVYDVYCSANFNLLALIYALLPGHNFGLAIILFTILVRLAIYPLLKKQLQFKPRLCASCSPPSKRLKKKAAGDRQKESMLLMELYKERGINPVGSIGVLIPQMLIFLLVCILVYVRW